MSARRVIEALELPEAARVERRVPKTQLLEHGAPTAADRRAVQDYVDEITWVAALKPASLGVPAYRDEAREYPEVAVLTMRLREVEGRRAPPVARLIELLHRAIPYPLLLVTQLPSEQDDVSDVIVSLAPLRRSLNEAEATVVEEVVASPPLAPGAPSRATSGVNAAFLASLRVVGLPRANLGAFYRGWLDRVVARQAAEVTGAVTIPRTPAEAEARREALEAYIENSAEVTRLRNEAKRERQTGRLVEINLELQRLEALRSQARAVLEQV